MCGDHCPLQGVPRRFFLPHLSLVFLSLIHAQTPSPGAPLLRLDQHITCVLCFVLENVLSGVFCTSALVCPQFSASRRVLSQTQSPAASFLPDLGTPSSSGLGWRPLLCIRSLGSQLPPWLQGHSPLPFLEKNANSLCRKVLTWPLQFTLAGICVWNPGLDQHAVGSDDT